MIAHIRVPFNPPALELEPHVHDADEGELQRSVLAFINHDPDVTDEELRLIVLSAAALMSEDAPEGHLTNVWAALETAIVWSRG